MSLTTFTSRARILSSTLGCALFSLTAACTTGQIGGEIETTDTKGEGDENASGDNCEVVETTALSLDELTSIGLAPQDVIDAISGTHETTLAWGEEPPGVEATLIPDAGETAFTIEVAARAESAVLVELRTRQSGREDEMTLEEVSEDPCGDEIRIVADVTLTSENGALNDSLEVMFRAQRESVVTGSVALVPGELEGTFDVTTDSNGEPVQTNLSLSFAFGTVSGEISGVWQEVHGDPGDNETAVSGAPIVYGRFPANGCQSGILIDEDSVWSDTIRDAVVSQTEFEFTWQDGETTLLTLEPTVGTLCLELDPYASGGVITGPVQATIATEDGRVNAVWGLSVSAQIEGDSITSLVVSHVETAEGGYPNDEFEAGTGISGVESDATELGFDFTYTIGLEGEPTSGTLTILELVIPDCARPGYEPEVITSPDGGSGAPGCEGIDYLEIETATFTSAPVSNE